MKFKRFIILVLTFAMLISLVACNGGGNDNAGTAPDENVTDNTGDENKDGEENKDDVPPEPSPEEIAKAENTEYLKTVTYLDSLTFDLGSKDGVAVYIRKK